MQQRTIRSAGSRTHEKAVLSRMHLALSALILFAISFLPDVAQAANCTGIPINNEVYSIINFGSGKAVDVAGASKEAGANILSWDYKAGTNQHFRLRSTSDGYWTLQSVSSGLYIEVSNASKSDGANVIQWLETGAANQQWKLKQSTTGAFNLLSRHSSKSLTVAGSERGANVYQNQDAANASQRWYLNPVHVACAKVSGFAGMPGTDGLSTTTGGGQVKPVVVQSCAQLVSALTSDNAAVIHIPDNTTINCLSASRNQATCPISCPSNQDPGKTFYRVPVGNQTCRELGSTTNTTINRPRNETSIRVKSNKTLLGLGPNAKVIGGGFNLRDARNVIFRNFTIENINPGLIEAGDGVTLENSSHIWLDHLRFSRISDGHVDINKSRNITLSHNRFDGYNSAVCGSQHHYTSMIQNSQVTLHHNFFDRTSGRNPKLSGTETRVHLYNNRWRDVTYFSVNADTGAQAKLEYNLFENSAKPHWNAGNGYIHALIPTNRYTGRSMTDPYKDSGSDWVLNDVTMYGYQPDAIEALLAIETGPK